jgi:hypothetical protein
MARHIKVIIEPRDDGGICVYSDDLPGLVLSGKNRIGILADIEPAVRVLLEHNGGSAEGVIIDAEFVLPDPAEQHGGSEGCRASHMRRE